MYDNMPSALENKIYFVANSTFYHEMMETFRLRNSILDERVEGFKSEAEIWQNIGDLQTGSFILVFDETKPKNQLHFTVRSKNNHFQTEQQYSRDLPTVSQKQFNEYISGGFLGFQHAITKTFYDVMTNGSRPDYVIELERLPSPPHQPKASRIDDIGLYFIIFSTLICISLIFIRMVEEKACGFREQLKNATRFSFLNNVALFTINFIQLLILLYICLLITYIKGYWFSVNVFYAAVLIILFIISIISFTFLVSAFFESSKFNDLKKR